MFLTYPDVVTIADLTKMLGIGKNTAYQLIHDKTIKSVLIGRQHRIPKCYVIEYLQTAG
ncbi:MAG: helix-turn-helix domain-containing protein [Oscillospiraceae bacterium]